MNIRSLSKEDQNLYGRIVAFGTKKDMFDFGVVCGRIAIIEERLQEDKEELQAISK